MLDSRTLFIFFFLSCAALLVESEFSNQGLNLGQGSESEES